MHITVSIGEIARCFQALSDETRLRLLKAILSVKSDAGVCVCELVDALELPQYQVSRHLQQLKNAGWLDAEPHGTWVYYFLAKHLESWQETVLEGLRDQLDDPVFEEDTKKLRSRMRLRRKDVCVIGYSRDRE